MLQAQNGEDVQNDGNGEMLSLPETISIENYSLSYCWQAQKIMFTRWSLHDARQENPSV
jgi:hypothetical protein